MTRPVVACDWDGCLVTYRWPEHSFDWMPGAVDALHRLSERADVIVFTCRMSPGPEPWKGTIISKTEEEIDEQHKYIRDMLDSVGLGHVSIWAGKGKVGADAYIDDKAYRYEGLPNSWRTLTHHLLHTLSSELTTTST